MTKTILINAYEGAVLFENVPNHTRRDRLINLAICALNEQPHGRFIYSLSNVFYVANPILCDDEQEAWGLIQDFPNRLSERIQIKPSLVVDYPTFIAN